MTIRRNAPPLDSFLARSLLTLVIPQCYTLSIAGSCAVAAHRYGFPADLNAWGFIAGAVVASRQEIPKIQFVSGDPANSI